jgi:hypothetical protein
MHSALGRVLGEETSGIDFLSCPIDLYNAEEIGRVGLAECLLVRDFVLIFEPEASRLLLVVRSDLNELGLLPSDLRTIGRCKLPNVITRLSHVSVLRELLLTFLAAR